MNSLRSSTPHVTEDVNNPAEDGTVSRTKSGFMAEELMIGCKIGGGSFGDVHEGFYVGDKVAVKVFRIDASVTLLSCRGTVEEDIQNEADMMITKSNKHVVRLIHHSKSKKLLVMQHCANGPIFDFMRQDSNLSTVKDWSNRLKWMLQVALGMLVLHEEPPSVIHRDLKLPNILLDEYLDAKIGDFGLAIQTSEISLTHNNSSRSDLAMTYQPPEVRRGGRYSTKSDVYSFGLMMHELLLLKGPYGLSRDAMDVDIKVARLQENGEKPKIPEDKTSIPGEWNPCLKDYINLTSECIDDRPERRPEFREIARRLALIRKEYEKEKKAPPKFQTIGRILGVIGFIAVFLTFLFLLYECGRLIILGDSDGNQVNSRMKSDEYCFFEVLVSIGIIAFAAVCSRSIWIGRKCIWSFVTMWADRSRRLLKHLISRVKKYYDGRGREAPRCLKPSAFVINSDPKELIAGSLDLEMNAVPSCLRPELIAQEESSFCNAYLQIPFDPMSSQECLAVCEEHAVENDDNLV